MATNQFQACIPVVVPEPFALEGVDGLCVRSPAAEVGNGVLQSAAVAAGNIPDHTIDVEQQDGETQRSGRNGRLVG